MKTTSYVFMITALAFAAPLFAHVQPIVSVPNQAVVAARPAAEVFDDAAKLSQSVDGVLKSITDAASAANAVPVLQRVIVRMEAMELELGEHLSEEDMEKLRTSVDVDTLEASFAPEVERLAKVRFFDNAELRRVLIDILPARYHSQLAIE